MHKYIKNAIIFASGMLLGLVSDRISFLVYTHRKKKYSYKPYRYYGSYQSHVSDDYKNIIFETRSSAEFALGDMKDTINLYGVCTISDLYEIAGLKILDYTNSKYGWFSLVNASVLKCRKGYKLYLPKPVLL